MKYSSSKSRAIAPILSTLALFASASASAAPILITFEGVTDGAQIFDYYNNICVDADCESQNVDSEGNSGFASGQNYGISFSDNALVIKDNNETRPGFDVADFANAPSASTVMYFLNDLEGSNASDPVFLNFEAGFVNELTFYYSYNGSQGGPAPIVSIFSGLSGAGTQLATQSLISNYQNGCPGGSTTAGDPGAYCHWDLVTMPFTGTAQSVSFGGPPNFIGYDDIGLTPYSRDNGGDPEPAPAPATLALLGIGLLGMGATRRRRA